VQRLLQQAQGHAARHALPGGAAPGSETGPLHARGDLRHRPRPAARFAATFTQWVAAEVSAANGRTLYIPEGAAHGFQTLVDDTEVFYQITELFHAESTRGVRWDDPAFAIHWPFPPSIISARDRSYPDFTSAPPSKDRRFEVS
jgi:hypothetical protein